MGLILEPTEIKNCAKQMKSQLESNRNSYDGALRTVQNFVGNDSFRSESWDTLKGKVIGSHQMISSGMLALHDSLQTDLEMMTAILSDPESLDEDMLIQDILRLQEECNRYIEMIQKLRRLATRSMIYGVSTTQLLISQYQKMLENTKRELEILKIRLNMLREKADQTSVLFTSIDTLIQAVEWAINDAEVYISGKGELSGKSWEIIIPKEIEKINESLNCWIPEVMQLDGNTEQEKALAERINSLNNSDSSMRTWTQEEVNLVWKECERYYEETGVQVDPRLMLAIVISEGTGSFNTDNVNLAADGGSGPNDDFASDVYLAVELIGGKIVTYPHYQQDFSKAREEAYKQGLPGIKDYDDILHYLNWGTPKINTKKEMESGKCYAADNKWNSQVRQVYSELAYDKVSLAYTEYALSLGESKLHEISDEYGMEIISVDFAAKQEGRDIYNRLNGEYIIVGE